MKWSLEFIAELRRTNLQFEAFWPNHLLENHLLFLNKMILKKFITFQASFKGVLNMIASKWMLNSSVVLYFR